MEATLRDLQKVQFQALKDLTAFCDAHEIGYFLDSGTLLGAVRHQGFIPWDDDVDICMDYKNYRKFLRCRNELSGWYYVQNYRNDPTMRRWWTKVRVNGTTVTPRDEPITDTHAGACLDIFVISGVSPSRPGQALQRFAASRLKQILGRQKDGDPKNIRFHLRTFCARLWEPLSLRRIQGYQQACNTFYLPSDTILVTVPASVYAETIDGSFEGAHFKIPCDYDAVLTAYYGHWQEPPPENQRTGHGRLLIDLEHDYTWYLKASRSTCS